MSEHEHEHEGETFHRSTGASFAEPDETGAALYALGNVKPGMELFREVTGDREDPEVDNRPEVIRLKQEKHFHSGPPKVYHIIVNGRKKEASTKTLTFNQVVALAFKRQCSESLDTASPSTAQRAAQGLLAAGSDRPGPTGEPLLLNQRSFLSNLDSATAELSASHRGLNGHP